MKFMTRELYVSAFDRRDEGADAQWQQAWDAYAEELRRIQPELPPGMRAFSGETLGGGIVRSVARPSPSELVLEVDATELPRGLNGLFRITFTGVRDVQGADSLLKDEWLYEEVHLHPDAAFDYRVLFWHSDFRVVADEVAVEKLPYEQAVIAAWIAMCKAERGTPEHDQQFWAFDRVWDMCRNDPDAAWRVILAVLEADQSNAVIERLSAGPLEDLLAKHPYDVIERVESEARRNPRFADLLGGVWQNAMPDDVWERVQAVWDRSTWAS